MSTNKTPNLKLHRWEPLDPFSREEINDNFAGLDAAWGDLEGRVLTEVETRADAITAEAKARADAVAAEAATRANADAALRTDLTAAQNNIKSLQTAVAKCGNCKIVTATYRGITGGNTLGFPGKPLLVIIRATETPSYQWGEDYVVIAVHGLKKAAASFWNSNTSATADLTWGENSLTITGGSFNVPSYTYTYVALIAADE